MISFKDYANTYHPGMDDECSEYKYLEKCFNESYKAIVGLNPEKEYDSDYLAKTLFDDCGITSQTSFYRARRMFYRIMLGERFNYKTLKNLSSIEFDDVFAKSNFAKEYFGSLEDLIDSVKIIESMDRTIDRKPAMALVCLMWDGITLVDSIEIQISDINFQSGFLKAQDKIITLSDETIRAIDSHLMSRSLKSIYLFCGRHGNKAHITTTNKILTGLNKAECGRRYTTSNINYSGQFYRAYRSGQECIEGKHKDINFKYQLWIKCFG